jgi:1-hydroxycarotenoid 3,4-desaturase
LPTNLRRKISTGPKVMRSKRVVVIGAGIGGLVAALDLAAQGIEVCVVERAAQAGGKLREMNVGGAAIDAGPTVFTMRWVFDQLFDDAGEDFSAHLKLRPAEILARHAWSIDEQLDLHADLHQSAAAIADFAGGAEAARYLEFAQRARRIYQTLELPFIRSECASPQALVRALGTRRLPELWQISPFTSLWRALGEHFHDPRLRQLFGRYATYCGSSPFQAPATLMLVAHVEQEGVWLVEGGMRRLAAAVETAATKLGATFRYGADVREIVVTKNAARGVRLASGELIEADAVIVNADVAAIADGHFGLAAARAVPRVSRAARSLSAVTWAMLAQTAGFPLSRHNVFFSRDYNAEFDAAAGPERLLCLINAPANGDAQPVDTSEIVQCHARIFDHLRSCGLTIKHQPEATQMTTPQDFNRLFPATGGALYGPATHGWQASFARQGARSRIAGIYLAGGSTHPGPGVPMAALSGRNAATSLIADWASTGSSRRAAMPGGISTR